LSQLLSKVTSHPAGITSNVQCVRLAAGRGRRTQAGDATDQRRDHWKISKSLMKLRRTKNMPSFWATMM